jgi:RNA polymerase sigma factor (sigma-70 family)
MVFLKKYFLQAAGSDFIYNSFTVKKNRLQEPNLYTEPGLIEALKNHKNEAYRHLYLHYRGSLYTIITQIIPDTETANDVLQEVFVTIWQNIEKYDAQKGRLYTWLFNLTRNAAINKTRSKNYKNSLKNEDISNYVNNTDEKGTWQNINQIGLRKEVGRLKEDLKIVLELSYFNGFTQEEIAKTLNIPLGTVKTRLRNAVIELRKKFV